VDLSAPVADVLAELDGAADVAVQEVRECTHLGRHLDAAGTFEDVQQIPVLATAEVDGFFRLKAGS
jgi:hypothetical protein